MIKNAAAKRVSTNVLTETVSPRLAYVMAKLNVPTSLTKEMLIAALRSSHSTTIKNVDVPINNSNVEMETVSLRPTSVMENHTAPISLMRVTRNVASTTTSSTTTRDVAATQKLSGPVPTENASETSNSVTVRNNVWMILMKANNAASRNSHSTTTRDAAATHKPSGPVVTVTVLPNTVDVMVKPNVPMEPMKVTRTVALAVTRSMEMNNAVAIQRANGHALTVNASSRLLCVTVKPNAPINLMKEMPSAASRNTLSTTLNNAAATQPPSGPVPTDNALLNPKCVMAKLNVPTDLMTVMTSAVSRASRNIHLKDVVA
jgi:hypothetical protein